LKKTSLQGAFVFGGIPKRNRVRASKDSWEGDFYLQFQGKTRFLHKVFVKEPNIAIASLEMGPKLPRIVFSQDRQVLEEEPCHSSGYVSQHDESVIFFRDA
jgi:hypothetical protein